METTISSLLVGQMRIEYLKLRRHVVLGAVIVTPLIGIGIGVLDILHDTGNSLNASRVIWKRMYLAFWIPWIAALLPTVTSFYVSALMHLEHADNHWKHLVTYPAPMWGTCAAKMIYASLLSGFSTILYSVGWAFFWMVLSKINPDFVSSGPPSRQIVSIAAAAWLASLLIIPLQTWISARITGVGIQMLLAIMCLFAGIALFNPDSLLSYLYPWTLCLSTGQSFAAKHNSWLPALVGLLGGICAGVVVSWRLSRNGGAVLVR
jgi:hypothetical protein